MLVYCIISDSTKSIYIGSTENYKSRMCTHISSFKTGQISCSSKYVLEKDDYRFEILKKLPDTTTGYQLRNIEREYIIQYRNNNWNVVNRAIPNRTSLDYYYDHQEELNGKMKNRYHTNENARERVKQQSLNRYYAMKEFKRLSNLVDVFTP